MKDLVECGIPDALGARQCNEWKSEPLTDEWNVARSKQGKRVRFHVTDVGSELRRIVSGAGAIWTCDQDHHWDLASDGSRQIITVDRWASRHERICVVPPSACPYE